MTPPNKSFLDAFFFVLGFENNPTSQRAQKVIDTDCQSKIQHDLRRVNSDYRKAFEKVKADTLILE